MEGTRAAGAGQGQRRRFIGIGQVERSRRRDVPQRLADPAFAQRLGGAGGVPDVHRAEMRLARIRITDALHDAQGVVLQQAVHAAQRRMQADAVIDTQRVLNAQRRPQPIVVGIVEGDDGVESVVAAGELHDDENGVARPLCLSLRRLSGGAADEVRDRPVQSDKARTGQRETQEITAGVFHGSSPTGEPRGLSPWNDVEPRG